MSKIIVCPFCSEYIGYVPKSIICCAVGTATCRKATFKQEYAECANCGELFLNPAFEKENLEALEKAEEEVLKSRHLPS